MRFSRTLLMVLIAGMLSACSTVGAQVAPHRQHIRPQPRVSVQFYLGQGYYYRPYYYRPHRHVIIHRHVVPERGVINRSRVTPRPNPQRRRSMNQRPDRQERPNVDRPARPNVQPNQDRQPNRDRARRVRPRGVSLDGIRERISAWAIQRRTSRPALLEMPELPVIDVFEFSDDYYIDFDYLPEPPPLPEPLGESYDRR